MTWIEIDINLYAKEEDPSTVVNIIELQAGIADLQLDIDDLSLPVSQERIDQLVEEEQNRLTVMINERNLEMEEKQALLIEIQNGNS